MPAIVTQASNPVLWQKLFDMWISERRPGWIMDGKTQYQVIQNTSGEREFHEQGAQSLYETTSFR